MELRQLSHFVVVAEELNFRRAAERLHVSQPPLSAQIKGLEDELGVRLFERSSRGVKLTSEGRVFLEHARTVLATADIARQSAQNAGQGMVGTLRVGIMFPIMTVRLAGIFLTFRRKYPAVRVFLHELSTAAQLERLQNDQLDAGLMRPPLGSPGMETRLLGESPLLLAVPRGHHLARRRNIEWADFHGEPIVLLQPSLQFGLYDEFFHQCSSVGAVPHVSQYANNGDTLCWLVAAGMGMTVGPNIGLMHSGIVFRDPPSGLPPMQTMLVWKGSNTSPALANFLKCFPSAQG